MGVELGVGAGVVAWVRTESSGRSLGQGVRKKCRQRYRGRVGVGVGAHVT